MSNFWNDFQIRLGLSIGNTLDSFGENMKMEDMPSVFETAWGNPVITKEYVRAVLETGINLIRIPVTWSGHTGDAPDYLIEENWMMRIQEVVDYVYEEGAYVILNLHHENWNDPYYKLQDMIAQRMRAVWTQIADRFAEYDERLIFEAQNEPRKIGTDVEWTGGDQEGWDVVNAINQVFVDTIRSRNGKNKERYLMVPGYAANASVAIHQMQVPWDDKIIVSVHAYVPYEFALQIPGRCAWNYETEVIDKLMDDLKTLFIDQGVPVIIGEFGALNKDNEEERSHWVRYYLSKAKKIGVPCVWWDNALFEGAGENFGIFDRRTFEPKFPQLFQAMLEATESD